MILDQHAPIKKKSVPNQKLVPWLTKAIRDEIRKCRRFGAYSGDMTGQTWIDTMIFAHSAGWFPIYFLLQRRSIIMTTFVNTRETSNKFSSCAIVYLVGKKSNYFPLD